MSTWIPVNLPFFPSRPLELPSPDAILKRKDLLPGGLSFLEVKEAHDALCREIWHREGFDDLLEESRKLILASEQRKDALWAQITQTPIWAAHLEEQERCREVYSNTYFRHRLARGMLLELRDGRQFLVGDIPVSGVLGCEGETLGNVWVVRYMMLDLPPQPFPQRFVEAFRAKGLAAYSSQSWDGSSNHKDPLFWHFFQDEASVVVSIHYGGAYDCGFLNLVGCEAILQQFSRLPMMPTSTQVWKALELPR